MDEIYILLNVIFVLSGFRGLRVIYGAILGGLLAVLYAFVTDPDVMLGLLLITGGTIWLVLVLIGAILGGFFTLIGVVLRRAFARVRMHGG